MLLFVIWTAVMLPLIILIVFIQYKIEKQTIYYLFTYYLILDMVFGSSEVYYYE